MTDFGTSLPSMLLVRYTSRTLALLRHVIHTCLCMLMPLHAVHVPCRRVEQLSMGFLQAPHGSAATAFIDVVGYSILMAWDAEVAKVGDGQCAASPWYAWGCKAPCCTLCSFA